MPGRNQKSRRPGYHPKQLRARGTGGTNKRHYPHGSRLTSKLKPAAGVHHHDTHPRNVPKHVGNTPGHNKHDAHHKSSATLNGKPRGSTPTSTATGNSHRLDESTVGSSPMPHPGMPMGGYPDYGGGMGVMGTMMALQMAPGAVASLGEAGNGIARTVLENRPTGGGSNDEDSSKEKGKKTDKEKDDKAKDNKEKDKNKNNGMSSDHGRA
ncbi:uncharacterized protein LOC119373857 isoform X2 [Rhipicephalus sanguineus]|nr:uncharacterized protein LOC119373857 isoform X2 [Rhipicephalus sanguineus]